MAIQVRRGNYSDFDPTKMVAGEFAVCLDNGYVYIALSPGNVIKLGTADTIEEAVEMAQGYASEALGYANDASGYANDASNYASDASGYANGASGYADNASSSASDADASALKSEGYANGEQNGTPVTSGSPYYHNNAEYFAQKAEEYKDEAAAIVGIGIATVDTAGIVKPDGTTITIDQDGTLHGAGGGSGNVTQKNLTGTYTGSTTEEIIANVFSDKFSGLSVENGTYAGAIDVTVDGYSKRGTYTLSKKGAYNHSPSALLTFEGEGYICEMNGNGVYFAKKIADLTDVITKSATAGLVKNDGTIDTNSYAKSSEVAATQTLLKDTVGFDCRNEFNYELGKAENNTAWSYTDKGKYIRVYTTSNATYRRATWNNLIVTSNKDYKISCYANITSGSAFIEVKTLGGTVIKSSSAITASGNIDLDFNTGANSAIQIVLYCTAGTSEAGDVTYTDFMLYKAAITDSTFEPHHDSVEQCKFDRAEQAILGAKNLLENKLSSKTKNSIVCTVNADKSITLNGTNSSGTTVGFVLSNDADALTTSYDTPFKSGETYIFSGGGTGDPYNIRLLYKNGSYVTPTQNAPYTLTADVACVYIAVGGSATVNATVKPMIRLASDPDDTYVPHAMTNLELTEKVFEKGVLTSTDDLNNIIETGLYKIQGYSPINAPENVTWCSLLVNKVNSNNVQQQIFKAGLIYQRSYSGSPVVWNSWYKFTGTVVS